MRGKTEISGMRRKTESTNGKTALPFIKVKSYATSLFPLSQKRSLSWNF